MKPIETNKRSEANKVFDSQEIEDKEILYIMMIEFQMHQIHRYSPSLSTGIYGSYQLSPFAQSTEVFRYKIIINSLCSCAWHKQRHSGSRIAALAKLASIGFQYQHLFQFIIHENLCIMLCSTRMASNEHMSQTANVRNSVYDSYFGSCFVE